MFTKRIFIIGILIFWMISIGLFILSKEFILAKGKTFLIPIEPVDPRDMFRGDYVVLNYNISRFDKEKYFSEMRDYIPDINQGDIIYVLISIQDGKADEVIAYSKSINFEVKDTDVAILKGTVTSNTLNLDEINVEYGIESFFVPEGVGRQIERCGMRHCVSEEFPVSMEDRSTMYAKVAVNNKGNAIIKSLILSDGEEIK